LRVLAVAAGARVADACDRPAPPPPQPASASAGAASSAAARRAVRLT
jgi:hypothetical protein